MAKRIKLPSRLVLSESVKPGRQAFSHLLPPSVLQSRHSHSDEGAWWRGQAAAYQHDVMRHVGQNDGLHTIAGSQLLDGLHINHLQRPSTWRHTGHQQGRGALTWQQLFSFPPILGNPTRGGNGPHGHLTLNPAGWPRVHVPGTSMSHWTWRSTIHWVRTGRLEAELACTAVSLCAMKWPLCELHHRASRYEKGLSTCGFACFSTRFAELFTYVNK
ncbi:hypothetical protein HaLaN_03966 [Haematococcus lacustris]|uniref:Uncharacterized protein n=1 Tax=Haematococcus lacustris TaxID=44745 RepID=A0A699YHH8_HAELA|nr:hypothetical protein HaLaN_03966 [Haematococcus lacustris]